MAPFATYPQQRVSQGSGQNTMQIRAPVQGCRVLRPAPAPRAALRPLAKRRSSVSAAEKRQTSQPIQARPVSSDAMTAELSEDESEQAAWAAEPESIALEGTPLESSTQYKVGDVALGVVKSVQPFGAFIDLGEGVTGLLHKSQVVIHRLDHKTGRIALSTKKAPLSIPEDMKVGDVVLGVVQQVKPYGVFMDLAKGVRGLLHISQISNTRIKRKLSELFKQGDEFKVMILQLDAARGRITLSTKKLEPSPGDMINNRQRVFEQAEQMAADFLVQKQQADDKKKAATESPN